MRRRQQSCQTPHNRQHPVSREFEVNGNGKLVDVYLRALKGLRREAGRGITVQKNCPQVLLSGWALSLNRDRLPSARSEDKALLRSNLSAEAGDRADERTGLLRWPCPSLLSAALMCYGFFGFGEIEPRSISFFSATHLLGPAH